MSSIQGRARDTARDIEQPRLRGVRVSVLAAEPSIDDRATRRIFLVRRAGLSAATPGDPSRRCHTIARLPGKAIKTLRRQGPKAMALKTLARVRITRSVIVYAMQREQVLTRGTPVPGVTVRLLNEGDIPAYRQLRSNPAEEVIARLRRGDRGIVAWYEGRVVGARWLTTVSADIPALGVSFPVHSGIAYAYDLFTAPEERGRGIGAMVTAASFECAIAAGAPRLINAVLPDNRGGQGVARRRSRRLGMLRSHRLGSRLIVRCQLPPGYLGAPMELQQGEEVQ
jgi:GNAT superfamily N-acetyltransferase